MKVNSKYSTYKCSKYNNFGCKFQIKISFSGTTQNLKNLYFLLTALTEASDKMHFTLVGRRSRTGSKIRIDLKQINIVTFKYNLIKTCQEQSLHTATSTFCEYNTIQ